MASTLVPGQNAVLHQRILHFRVSGEVLLDLSALIVGEGRVAESSDDFVFYNQPRTTGVELTADSVFVELDKVTHDAFAVLCIVSADTPGTPLGGLQASLHDHDGTPIVAFTVPPGSAETATICFELYRRGADWKVRAVGQGYAGGLPELLCVHGVEVDDAPPDPAAPSAPQLSPTGQAPAGDTEIPPLDKPRSLERMWMIFEDAARTTSAVEDARDHALNRLDRELSEAVADPAQRNSPAGDEARAAAQRRYDELVAVAEARYRQDVAHLVRELEVIDSELPPSLSSWQSPTWQSARQQAIGGTGIRLGELSRPERDLLRVPFCVPVPLRRPLWVDTASALAAAPVVTAMVLRLIAASPVAPMLDVVDLTGSLQAMTGPLKPFMREPPVSSHHDISTKLDQLVNEVDRVLIAAEKGIDLEGDEESARVVVLSDFGHGLNAEDLARVAVLAARGAAAHLSLVIVGEHESTSPEPPLKALAEHCHLLAATVGNARISDPWTHNEWEFTPDSIPHGQDQLTRFIASVIR